MRTFIGNWLPVSAYVFVLVGCGSGQSATKQEQESTPPVSSAVKSGCSSVDLPAAPPAAGQLVLTLPSEIDPCSVSGYIVGNKDLLKVQKASEGKYFINNVPAGKRDVILTAGTLSLKLDSPGDEKGKTDRGRRLESASVLNGVRTELGKIDLPKFGSVSGIAKLNGQKDHAGIEVYVPGTSMIAKTDAEGRFSIPNMPAGKHNLYFDKDGFHRAQVEAISIEPEKATSLAPMDLVLSTGAEGFLLIENGSSVVKSRTVRLTIGATEEATLMKVAETDSFEGTKWKPIVSSTNYTFATPGSKTLFVKFANANGLESSPFRAIVNVDLFPDSELSFEVDNPLINAPALPKFNLKNISWPSNASAVLVSTDSTFVGATWQSPVAAMAVEAPKLLSSCGPLSVYLKFKDKDAFESPVLSKPVRFSCSRKISTTGSSLYRNGSSVTSIGSKVLVLGGYVLPANPDVNSNRIVSASLDARVYDVETDQWADVGPAPEGRSHHTAIAAGSEVLIWGGGTQADWNPGWAKSLASSILSYSPASNTWQNLGAGTNAPSPRFQHSAVWTGTDMIVFGGRSNDNDYSAGACLGSGFFFNRASGAWTPISSVGAPGNRCGHVAVWTGTEMLVFGGYTLSPNPNDSSGLNPIETRRSDGAAYNPSTDTWRTIASNTIARGTSRFGTGYAPIATFSGGKMLVFGGNNQFNYDIYDTSSDSWSSGGDAPLDPQLGFEGGTWIGRAIFTWPGEGGPSSKHPAITSPFPFE